MPNSAMSSPDLPAQSRVDKLYAGRFVLHQPATGGFRAGLDALLLAACVPADASGECADIGAGTGAVGCAAATRAVRISTTLVENESSTAALIRASIADPCNAAIAPRLRVAELDILSGRASRQAAGLEDRRFALVLTNPPFFPETYRRSPDPLREAALFTAGSDVLLRWLRACAALVSPRGRLAVVARPSDLPAISQALERRLGALAVLPVHTRPGPARRILVGARAGSRESLSILPGLDLWRDEEVGRAIADGTCHLDLFAGQA